MRQLKFAARVIQCSCAFLLRRMWWYGVNASEDFTDVIDNQPSSSSSSSPGLLQAPAANSATSMEVGATALQKCLESSCHHQRWMSDCSCLVGGVAKAMASHGVCGLLVSCPSCFHEYTHAADAIMGLTVFLDGGYPVALAACRTCKP